MEWVRKDCREGRSWWCLQVLLVQLCISADFSALCDARNPGPPISEEASTQKLLKAVKHFDDVAFVSSDPYYSYVGSPFSLPPYDDIMGTPSPASSPEGQPIYCIFPPPTQPEPPSSSTTPSPTPPAPGLSNPLLPPTPPPPPSSSSPSSSSSPPPPLPPPPPSSTNLPPSNPTYSSPPSSLNPIPPPPDSNTPSTPIIPNPPIIEPSPPGYDQPPSLPYPPGREQPPTLPNPPGSQQPPSLPNPPGTQQPPALPNPPSSQQPPNQPGSPGYIPFPPITFVPSPPQTYLPPTFNPGSPPTAFLPPIVFPPPTIPKTPPSGPGYTEYWCVAKPSVPDPIILEAMNYACASGADCDAIQPSGLCYEPDTLIAHASFAFNSYWQRTKAAGGTCDFGGTATLITRDPSFDGCHYLRT